MLTRTGKFTAIGLVLVGALASGVAPAAAADRAAALKRELGPGVRVSEHRGTGLVRFVGTSAGRPIARPSGLSASVAPSVAARAFLGRHGDAFGIRDQARDLRATATARGTAGRSTIRFQQLHDGLPVLGGELVVSLDGERNVLSASGEALATDVATAPAVEAGAARAAAVAAVARGEGVSAFQLDGHAAGARDLRRRAARRSRPRTCLARLAARGDQPVGADRSARPRRRPARHGGPDDRPDRAREEPHRLRRRQRERPGPVHRADRHGSGPARGRRQRRRRPCLRVRRGHVRLLRRPRPRQPRRQRHDAEVDRPVLRSGSDVPVQERVLGRRADGLRRGLRGGGRRRRARAGARRHRVQLPPQLLLPIGRDQRIALRRLRRADRPDQRRGQRCGGGEVAARRGHPRRRGDPGHGDPGRLRRPRSHDEPQLHRGRL